MTTHSKPRLRSVLSFKLIVFIFVRFYIRCSDTGPDPHREHRAPLYTSHPSVGTLFPRKGVFFLLQSELSLCMFSLFSEEETLSGS